MIYHPVLAIIFALVLMYGVIKVYFVTRKALVK